MKTPRLARNLALAALALGLALPRLAADGLPEDTLRDHVDAQVPAYLKIRSLTTKVLGNPAVKVKAELELEAAETLYTETVKEPALKPVATELTGDLRAEQPKALRLLKVVTREGAVTRRLNFDFAVKVTAAGTMLGTVSPHLFESFGQPRSEFAAGAVAEDTEEGHKALAAFEAGVKNHNEAVARMDKRAGNDRLLKNSTTVLDKGLTVYDKVTGQGSNAGPGNSSGGGLREAFGTLTGLLNGTAVTNSAPASAVPAVNPKPAAKPAGNPFGQLLGNLPTQFTANR